MTKDDPKLMRVGELAKAVGKTVRAMHLYEELGLLEPRSRSEGGFRLYGPEAIEDADSGREATARVRALFTEKQAKIREQIMQLQVIENDLSEALAYLDSCQTCTDEYAPAACGVCDHHGHQRGEAPPLFAGLSRRPGSAGAADDTKDKPRDFDVPVTVLYREGNN
ncbi:MAG: MerR family DNA-binding transcriptional regulator [Deltaproteobacteria bacterium]|nr:MAG: MerR family DNA-binding transcriptional regulator [Deltaproteobacteria bacterium]